MTQGTGGTRPNTGPASAPPAGTPPDTGLTSAPPAGTPPNTGPASAPPAGGHLVHERLTFWFWFGVVFGILPIIFDTLRLIMAPDGFRVNELLGGGEGLISSAAIAGAAIGELIFSDSARNIKMTSRLNTLAPCLILCLSDSIAYTQVDPLRPWVTVYMTYILFPLTVAWSGACVRMAAKR